MTYEITGKLIAKYDEVQRTATFKTREFVIEVTESGNGRDFTNYVKMQCVQDRTAIVNAHKIGDMVKVSFNIRGTKWSRDGKENYITNLDAWRMEGASQGNAQPEPDFVDATGSSTMEPPADDLPF